MRLDQIIPFFLLILISVNAFSEVKIQEGVGPAFKIGDTSHSSSGWCSWFSPFQDLGTEHKLILPVGWTDKTRIVFCDRATIQVDSKLEFLSAINMRYPRCLNITVDDAAKEIIVKIGDQLVQGSEDEQRTFSVVTNGVKTTAHVDNFSGRINNFCFHSLDTATEKDRSSGHFKIIQMAIIGADKK